MSACRLIKLRGCLRFIGLLKYLMSVVEHYFGDGVVREGFLIALASVLIPLLSISLSIFQCGWFNIYDNALSDLGHSVNSSCAWLFNFGISTGGVLMIVFSSVHAWKDKKIFSLIFVIGYLCVLVGVFDEVYGFLHFIVSFLLFVSLLLFVVYYAYSTWRDLSIRLGVLLLILANLFMWYTHFVLRVPRGIAIPELLSTTTFIPFYMHLAWRLRDYKEPS